jgi:hypothetical protein
MSRGGPFQCRKTFVRQTIFLIHDLYVLSFGPTEACRHVQRHVQLSEVGVIMNFCEQTFEGSSEMFY